MKLTFFLRIRAKKRKQQEVPVYVRLRDDSIDILQKTFIMVAPEKWDPKTEDLKAKVVMPLEEREKFSDQIHELRKYIRQCYDKDAAKNLVSKEWLIKVLAEYSKKKDAPPPKEKTVSFEKLFTKFLKEHRLADTRKRQMLVVMRAVMRFELYNQKSGSKTFYNAWKTINAKTVLGNASGVTVSAVTASSAKVSWKAAGGAAGYRVFNGSTKLADVRTTTATISVSPATTYKITVVPYNGTTVGKATAAVSFTSACAKVTGLKASSGGYNSVKLSWSKVTGATGYRVYKYDGREPILIGYNIPSNSFDKFLEGKI